MAGRCEWQGPCKLIQDQKVRKQIPGPGRQMAPPPQEKDSTVSGGLDHRESVGGMDCRDRV